MKTRQIVKSGHCILCRKQFHPKEEVFNLWGPPYLDICCECILSTQAQALKLKLINIINTEKL